MRGLSSRARELADGLIRIDLVGFSGSLNLSVSAAIVLWELRRAEIVSDSPGDLSPAELSDLRGDWYRRLLGKRVRTPEALETWVARGAELAAEAGERERVSARERLED